MSKWSELIYEDAPDERTVARWNARRRRRDKVDELGAGFSFRASGRQGYIYYREEGRIMELYWEMSGVDEYDILLSLNGLREWALPHVEPVDSAKQKEILTDMQSWLVANNVRAKLEEHP